MVRELLTGLERIARCLTFFITRVDQAPLYLINLSQAEGPTCGDRG